ncbi:30S ribosome-binding factor RbfA [Opitutus terrae]|uniref:Ribosome-binding factor A n=1 Tax=Opitutus terrae (strain DSM 11246 / JCM 15787 / PB90-1) TaxID=452637 RepID=RBFA_OPITP|nr:30S ribosome-binding factor RbfA [Opitutus terrae]B1ZX44.1 RecName: Full=Ribosome-binding factor A [Opitutus terrae PB90-1]ACB76096.1 ribosome-binding factor A [Opitutus terrae PB90-1]
MSNRTLRVNELIQRELSEILRKRYQSEATAITITELRVAPDLRDARVFVSIVGSAEEQDEKLRWLRAHAGELRYEVGRRIVLKYLPKFEYVLDHSPEKSARILQVLDEIDRQTPPRPEAEND